MHRDAPGNGRGIHLAWGSIDTTTPVAANRGVASLNGSRTDHAVDAGIEPAPRIQVLHGVPPCLAGIPREKTIGYRVVQPCADLKYKSAVPRSRNSRTSAPTSTSSQPASVSSAISRRPISPWRIATKACCRTTACATLVAPGDRHRVPVRSWAQSRPPGFVPAPFRPRPAPDRADAAAPGRSGRRRRSRGEVQSQGVADSEVRPSALPASVRWLSQSARGSRRSRRPAPPRPPARGSPRHPGRPRTPHRARGRRAAAEHVDAHAFHHAQQPRRCLQVAFGRVGRAVHHAPACAAGHDVAPGAAGTGEPVPPQGTLPGWGGRPIFA